MLKIYARFWPLPDERRVSEFELDLASFCLVRTESCNCYTLPPPMPTTTSHSTFLILQLLSMGNEQSSTSSNSQSYKDILKHVDTDDPILATSGWAFYHAQPFPPHETHNGPLSLFISQGNFQDLKNLGKVYFKTERSSVVECLYG